MEIRWVPRLLIGFRDRAARLQGTALGLLEDGCHFGGEGGEVLLDEGEVDLAGGLQEFFPGGRGAAGGVAEAGEAVAEAQEEGVFPGLEGALGRDGGGLAGGVGEGDDQAGDLRAETALDLGRGGGGGLQNVVEQGGGNHLYVAAAESDHVLSDVSGVIHDAEAVVAEGRAVLLPGPRIGSAVRVDFHAADFP